MTLAETTKASRISLSLFLVLYLANCWMWMQGIHECGHVIAAIVSSGHVTCVVWHFAAISRTDVSPNPHPLFVCWAGAVLGSVVPLMVALLYGKPSGKLRFFAGFCLVANGAYLSVGSIDRVGDAGELLRLGSPAWLLWITGGTAIVVGFRVWHRLGGFNELKIWAVSSREIVLQVVLMAVTLSIQLFFFPR